MIMEDETQGCHYTQPTGKQLFCCVFYVQYNLIARSRSSSKYYLKIIEMMCKQPVNNCNTYIGTPGSVYLRCGAEFGSKFSVNTASEFVKTKKIIMKPNTRNGLFRNIIYLLYCYFAEKYSIGSFCTVLSFVYINLWAAPSCLVN